MPSNDATPASKGVLVPIGQATASPSGRFRAEVSIVDTRVPRNEQLVGVRIQGPSAPELIARSTFASWRRLQFAWDAGDRLWVDSADVGLRAFALVDSEWRGLVWQPGAPVTPDPRRTLWDAETREDLLIVGMEPPAVLGRR